MTTDKEYELNGLLTEEECYQKKIIETVKNVKRKDILIYIFNIVEDIAKEDRTKWQTSNIEIESNINTGYIEI